MRKVTEVTTEQIREATSKGFVASLGYKSISDTQFDLWLAAERNRVAELAMAKEREEIIASLEKGMNYLADAVRNRQMDIVPGVERYRRIIEELRARGENK